MTIKISVRCTGCGACVAACPFQALTLDTDQPQGRGKKHAHVDSQICCSCGGCIAQCPHGAIILALNLSDHRARATIRQGAHAAQSDKLLRK